MTVAVVETTPLVTDAGLAAAHAGWSA